jgi:hypothetical protein
MNKTAKDVSVYFVSEAETQQGENVKRVQSYIVERIRQTYREEKIEMLKKAYLRSGRHCFKLQDIVSSIHIDDADFEEAIEIINSYLDDMKIV